MMTLEKKLNHDHLNQAIDLFSELVAKDREVKHSSKLESFFTKTADAFLILTLVGAVITLVLGAFAYVSRYIEFGLATLTTAAATYAFTTALLVLTGLSALPRTIKNIRSANRTFFDQVKYSTGVDLDVSEKLFYMEPAILKYALLQFDVERQALERRMGTVSGLIDKIGIFPALAGVATLYVNLTKDGKYVQLGLCLAILLTVFYLISFSCSVRLSSMDRVIALVEYHLEEREAQKKMEEVSAL
jgi:hypothetical protein